MENGERRTENKSRKQRRENGENRRRIENIQIGYASLVIEF
jgi:hypothetical protein